MTTLRVTDLDVRLRSTLSRDEALAFLRGVPGVKSALETLPGETDPDVRALYRVRVDPDAAPDVIASLRRDSRVVHVEVPPRRKPRHR